MEALHVGSMFATMLVVLVGSIRRIIRTINETHVVLVDLFLFEYLFTSQEVLPMWTSNRGFSLIASSILNLAMSITKYWVQSGKSFD